jgi:hypothetical protein
MGRWRWKKWKKPSDVAPRTCKVCGQAFKAQSDADWDQNRPEHERLSRRHQRALVKLQQARAAAPPKPAIKPQGA